MVSFSGRVSPLSLVASYPEQVSHAWVANERNVGTVIASEQDQHISAPTNHRKLPMYAMHRWAAPPPPQPRHPQPAYTSSSRVRARSLFKHVSTPSFVFLSTHKGFPSLGEYNHRQIDQIHINGSRVGRRNPLAAPHVLLLSALLPFFTPRRRRS
jgi:hypothetical protein